MAQDLLYAQSHRRGWTYQGLWLPSRGALEGKPECSVPRVGLEPTTHLSGVERATKWATPVPPEDHITPGPQQGGSSLNYGDGIVGKEHVPGHDKGSDGSVSASRYNPTGHLKYLRVTDHPVDDGEPDLSWGQRVQSSAGPRTFIHASQDILPLAHVKIHGQGQT